MLTKGLVPETYVFISIKFFLKIYFILNFMSSGLLTIMYMYTYTYTYTYTYPHSLFLYLSIYTYLYIILYPYISIYTYFSLSDEVPFLKTLVFFEISHSSYQYIFYIYSLSRTSQFQILKTYTIIQHKTIKLHSNVPMSRIDPILTKFLTKRQRPGRYKNIIRKTFR